MCLLSPPATLTHCPARPTCQCPGCPLPPLTAVTHCLACLHASRTVLIVSISNLFTCSPRLPDTNVPSLALTVLLLLMALLAPPPALYTRLLEFFHMRNPGSSPYLPFTWPERGRGSMPCDTTKDTRFLAYPPTSSSHPLPTPPPQSSVTRWLT